MYRGSFSIRGDFLYWQPVATGMAYALTRTNLDLPFGPFGPGLVPDNLSLQNVDVDYGPGYRIGARYTLFENEWDIDGEYTRFENSGSDSVLAGNGTLIDTLWDAISSINTTQASADLTIGIKAANICMGRTISLWDCFSMRPNFGVQWYESNSKEKIEYIGTTLILDVPFDSRSDIELFCNTKAVGLVAGLDAFWKLPCNFGLFGNAKYGISRSRFSTGQNQLVFITGQDDVSLTSSTSFRAMIQNFHLKGGLNWNTPLNLVNCCMNLDIYVAYEMSVYLQAIQITRVLSLGTGFSDANTTNIGNVAFHGLTTGIKVSF
ncbi:Lpg1974 family pore-forming outer membrane protein [Criblamydia sequanensis]|nr:Lpg1974 family pore-forming outer membrane protein [Criblamydia sequanensis]